MKRVIVNGAIKTPMGTSSNPYRYAMQTVNMFAEQHRDVIPRWVTDKVFEVSSYLDRYQKADLLHLAEAEDVEGLSNALLEIIDLYDLR